ncbi:YchJ family protein [Xylanimonas sp. McL0601]|uniref:YchJ family protein n=1 Tax=Xylanimonas sp. McL0601 TaxID=3414739 RepID=UPI003CF08E30
MITDGERCPCLSGLTFGECCAPIHRGERVAATAEVLMRSRYSAFAVGDAGWLRASWHTSTRPPSLNLDDDVVWRRLDILATRAGGPFDDAGEVEFAASWRNPATGERGSLHERSRFVREQGRWFYVDGDVEA